MSQLRPAQVCGALLSALDAADGRRRSRKRDQTPDAIGLAAKRHVLERAVRDDPGPEAFEDWALRHAREYPEAAPMALAVLEEWRLAHALPAFLDWLEAGAPSDDAGSPGTKPARCARR